jgi:PAS domain S-box-containing protein
MPGPGLSHARLRYFLLMVAVAAGYFILARASLLLSFQFSNATPVWPPSGFAFALLLLFGYRLAPGVLAGAFAANVFVFLSNHTADLPTALWVSLIISLGNTAEALAGCYLLKKMVPSESNNYFSKTNHIFHFVLTAFVMSLVSSITGTAAILLGGIITAGNYFTAWLTWWLGDVSGILLITSFILIWTNYFRSLPGNTDHSLNRKKIIELIAFFLLVLAISGVVFDNWLFTLFIFRWAFWVIPIVVWAAIRFNQHETVTAILLCSAIAIWGTVNGHGPFSTLSLNQSLLITQSYISIIVITTLTLNASVSVQRQTETALRDMTGQLEIRVKERLAELEERNHFIETLFDSVEDLMAVFDTGCNYLSVNKRIEDVYKLNREDIIGKNILELFPSVKESGMYDNLRKAIGGETVHNLAYRSVIANRYFENFFIPLKNNKEEVYGVLVIGHDNTIVMEAAEKIEAVNKKLTEAQRLAHIGSWQWDIAANRITWSDELFRIYGLTPREFEASYENYLRYIHPDERAYVNKTVQKAYADHQPFDFYHRIVRPNGDVRILHGRGEIFINEKKEPVSMAGTTQDVTEIKQAEEEIKQMADELMRYNKELERSNKELESFTFVASHDLQEPLRKIQTFLNLINEKEQEVLSDTSKTYLRRTINAAGQMQQLIIDLLAWSRTTGSGEHFKKTNLNAILQHVKNELKEIIEVKKARIESTELPELNGIPFQFQQFFTNMISNSLKFSKPDVSPHIFISSEIVDGQDLKNLNGNTHKKYHRISFTDNGIGFETKFNDKIFDLFQRLHSKNEYSGTGIGLSICKKIIENHQGIITAHGEQGKGATFIIYLPIVEA